MAYIYENDVGRLGGNLQTTVAYLLSLHKAEYEWNLLGIKVVGHVDALPIPDGTYEYGDAYTLGTAEPYDMWIYTRADEFHAEAYWFNIGKFPMPGPQGPKGDGLETILSGGYGNIQSVQYDTAHGARVNGTAVINYVDSTTGMPTSKSFLMNSDMPIVPGKYVSINATSDNKALEVKVDDTALALDYYKIDKTVDNSVPLYQNGKTETILAVENAIPNTLVKRNANNDVSFHVVGIDALGKRDDVNVSQVSLSELRFACNRFNSEYIINETSTDTGSITTQLLNILKQYPQLHIKYNNKIYYRMDPMEAPDGKLNYINIGYIPDGNGGYKATGKCFSVTVSIQAWKVFDLDFGGSTNSTIKIFPVELTLTNCQVDIKDPIVIEGTKTVLSVSVNNYLYSFNTPTVSGADFYWDVTGSAGSGIGPIGTLTLFNPKASSITVEIKAVEIG